MPKARRIILACGVRFMCFKSMLLRGCASGSANAARSIALGVIGRMCLRALLEVEFFLMFRQRGDVNVRCGRIKATSETGGSSCSSSSLGACSRGAPEIPTIVVDVHRGDFIRCKGNFLKAADLDDAALAGD